MVIFNASMKGKWAKRAYIELFAGPGLGVIRDTTQIINGSPLVAIEQPIGFTRHIFVDINKSVIDALEKRIKYSKSLIDVNCINGDCNSSIEEIKKRIDNSFLILTFIDPTSMQIRFSAIKELTANFHMDLIINFPLQAINRSYSYAMQGYEQKFDDFFGTNEWKAILNNLSDTRSAGAKLLGLYKEQLKRLGYGDIKDLSCDQQIESGDILVRGPKNIPLYYLIFASKKRIAYKFWDEVQKTRANSQRRLL